MERATASLRVFFLFFAFVAATSANAVIKITPLQSIQVDPLYPWGTVDEFVGRNGDRKVALLYAKKEIQIWNLTKQKKEQTFLLSSIEGLAQPDLRESQGLGMVEETPNGEIAAVFIRPYRHGDDHSFFMTVSNLTQGKAKELARTYICCTVLPLVSNGKLLVGLTQNPKNRSAGKATHFVWDASAMKLVSKLESDSSGFHFFRHDQEGNPKALLGDYGSLRLWDPLKEASTTLIENAPGAFPVAVTDNKGRELIGAGTPGSPKRTTFYVSDDLFMGKLSPVASMGEGEQVVKSGDGIIRVQHIPAYQGGDKSIEARDFETGVSKGKLALDMDVNSFKLTSFLDGKVYGLLGGEPSGVVRPGPGKAIFADFSENRVTYTLDTEWAVRNVSLATAADGTLFGQVISTLVWDSRATIVDPIAKKVLAEVKAIHPLAKDLIRMKDGRVGSLLANAETGEVCVTDWTDGQRKSCFPAEVFLKERLFIDYNFDAAMLGAGNTFLVRIQKQKDAFTNLIVGFQLFRLE